MNKTLQTFLCLCAATVVFASCQKDERNPTTTLRAAFVDNYTSNESGAKVVVDNNMHPSFVTGDKIWINGEEFTASVSEGVTTLSGSTDAPYNAVYPKSLVTSVSGGFPVELTLPAEQSYVESGGKQVVNAPVAAYGDGTTDDLLFKNVCSLIRVRVRNNMDKGDFTLSSITVTSSNSNLSGTTTIEYSGGEFSLGAVSGTNSVTLTGLTEVVKENKSSKDYYLYIPPVAGEGTQFAVKAVGTFQKQAMECTLQYETEESNITIDKSKFGGVSMLLNGCTVTAMHSAYYFSVAADRKVYFSPGNLQYQGSTGEWRFAEEQWIAFKASQFGGNCLSESDAKNTSLWIDLFGWGTSGWNCGGEYANHYYEPYRRIYVYNGSSKGYGYGPRNSSVYSFSLTDTYANSDWGVYNPIKNGGNTAGIWRTLTNNEWNYIFATRTNKNNLFARATVNGVAGLIILPDEWAGTPAGLEMITGSSSLASSNVYSISEWRLLEQNGAVFLPSTGCCTIGETNVTKTYTISDQAQLYYWSATNNGTDKAFRFNTNTVSTGTPTTIATVRYYRMAVRLVQDMAE